MSNNNSEATIDPTNQYGYEYKWHFQKRWCAVKTSGGRPTLPYKDWKPIGWMWHCDLVQINPHTRQRTKVNKMSLGVGDTIKRCIESRDLNVAFQRLLASNDNNLGATLGQIWGGGDSE